ncbi:unnamed protein product, partial [Closterium sp. NIES-54]
RLVSLEPTPTALAPPGPAPPNPGSPAPGSSAPIPTAPPAPAALVPPVRAPPGSAAQEPPAAPAPVPPALTPAAPPAPAAPGPPAAPAPMPPAPTPKAPPAPIAPVPLVLAPPGPAAPEPPAAPAPVPLAPTPAAPLSKHYSFYICVGYSGVAHKGYNPIRESRPVQFDTWLDDLQLYLLSHSKDSVTLFDLASGAITAPPATTDSSTRSQWLTRDAAAHLAIRNHLPLAECAHFGQHWTAQALYDAVVARYSSPATAALGRLLLPYLFPELSAFATVKDLVSHLHASDARYRATVPAEFLDRNPPPMYITLYFIVTRLLDSLRSVREHFLSLDPTSLIVELLEQHLLAAETSAVAVGAARGTPCPPSIEG